ncbi:acyltransferase family protein [Pseudomonas sp. URMO17WK12:I12]|uniref:acyltransferase family protein n=1 Tax=Pseudomonas sp. URMO17WK12:I12 TaxID=1259797 RepID=UPI0004823692|nr:acyltransferase family protein [Pseudomonas sp. URMO17WK12:I12]
MTSTSAAAMPAIDKHLSHPKYRPDIDGLRALAVLSVVAFHAFPSIIHGGFVGVDVFFVISGYLISSIIFGSLEKNSFSFGEFYSRRVNRIFPALLLVLAASWVFGWFTLLADEYMQLGKHIAGGSVFLSNFVLLGEAGYFDNTAETKLLLHLWSLGIEEQFYLIWPLLLWAAWKVRLNALLLVVITAAISFALNIAFIQSDSVGTFYSPQTRFWELLVGSFLAYMTMNKDKIFPNWRAESSLVLRNIQSIIGVACLAVAFAVITKADKFPGWWAILPTAGAALIIAAGPSAWFNRVILSNRVFVWFGLISFPLYLWHWPLLTFARIIESAVPSVTVRCLAVLLAIVLSLITYRFVERPLRTGGRGTKKTAVLIGFMVVTGIAGYLTYSHAGLPNRALIKDAERVNSQFVGPLWKYMKNDICLNKYPLKESSDYLWWFCMANNDQKPTLLILGTSFANHLYAGIASNPATSKNNIVSMGSCDPSQPVLPEESIPVDKNPCAGNRVKHQRDLADKVIDESGTVKYVIFSGLRPNVDAENIEVLNEYIDQLERRGVKVIVFYPHVRAQFEIKGCFPRPLKAPLIACELDRAKLDEIHQSFQPLVDSVTKRHPDAKFFDPNQLYCDDKSCKLVIDNMPLFRDEYSHFSEFASGKLAEVFVEWAKINAPGILIP